LAQFGHPDGELFQPNKDKLASTKFTNLLFLLTDLVGPDYVGKISLFGD
jgi:hypothetical protein